MDIKTIGIIESPLLIHIINHLYYFKMKKLITFLNLAAFISTGVLYAGTYSGGNGDVSNPYQIATLDDLIELSATPADHGAHFIQTLDIDAAASSSLNNGDGFAPIGKIGVPLFFGNYNGNGKIISNLTINRPSEDNIGLFGYVNGATISDIHLKEASITGNNYVGSIVGNLWNGANVRQSSVTDGSVTGKQRVGGIIGNIAAEAANASTTMIHKSYSTASVNGNDFVGGLAGYSTGRIEKCYAMSATVIATGGGIGGLVGQIDGAATISECYAAGGTVTGAPGYSGGAIGFASAGIPTSNIEKLYWNTERTSQLTSAGGEGKTTNEMLQQATYVGWDFSGTWKFAANRNFNHPILYWQNETLLPTTNLTTIYQGRNIYPTYANDLFYIRSDKAGQISIFDIYGNTVKNAVIHTGENCIDISHLPTGIYLVTAHTTTAKIIKR